MPTYVYQAREPALSCEQCANGFEKVERISAEPLTFCPACGEPIHRVIQPSFFNKSGSSDRAPSDKKLENLGFTKIVKDDDGKYKKAFGKDPAADILPKL